MSWLCVLQASIQSFLALSLACVLCAGDIRPTARATDSEGVSQWQSTQTLTDNERPGKCGTGFNI